MACRLPSLFLILLGFLIISLPSAGVGWSFEEGSSLLKEILRYEAVHRLKHLGTVSDAEGYLQRTFLSPAAIQAGNLIREWMQDAGLTTWVDPIGNIHGRSPAANLSAPAILLGSHLDTVIDAGIYDGALGIISSIAAVKALHISGKLHKFPRPIEVIAFSDEEGVRFQSTFLGSAAISGKFPVHALNSIDKSGVTLQDALRASSFDGTSESLIKLKYNPDSVWGYIEVHIEQGPVLEREAIPVGVVGAIAGQTRLSVTIQGLQGHAGTVPMVMRKDPMPAAAEVIVAIEHLCNHPDQHLKGNRDQHEYDHLVSEGALVCTVGKIAAWPGASNVIPGEVQFTVDVRAEDDTVRAETVKHIESKVYDICLSRGVSCNIVHNHEASAVICNSELQKSLQKAATSALEKLPISKEKNSLHLVPKLVSGAGHDAMAMAHLTRVGMLFVRCTGGISHSPAEHVLDEDVWAASLSVLALLEDEMQKEMIVQSQST